jgi:lysophospholipase L1-like esterase
MSTPLAIFDGDSMTDETAVEEGGESWPTQYRALVGGEGWETYNIAQSGQTLAMMNLDVVSQVNSKFDATRPMKVYIFAGTNDMRAGASGETAFSRLATYITAIKAAGYRGQDIRVLTCLPRTGDVPVDFETQRQTHNGLIIANQSTYGYIVVDIASDSRIGLEGCNLDPTYYAEEVHPNNTGRGVIAELVAAAG